MKDEYFNVKNGKQLGRLKIISIFLKIAKSKLETYKTFYASSVSSVFEKGKCFGKSLNQMKT
jgi:hypothetical protein